MNDNSPMLARLSAFVVWALVAGAIVFWGLRLFVSPTPAPANAVAVVDTAAAGGDLSRLFGVTQAAVPDSPPPESSRFRLLGVLAAKDAGDPADSAEGARKKHRHPGEGRAPRRSSTRRGISMRPRSRPSPG